MTDTAVTIVIPAYRSDERLVRTLHSVAAQTFPPAVVELSFDAAPGYVPPPLPHVPGLRVRHQPVQLGWVAHVNRLIEQVSTPYFLMLAHDDSITPRYLRAAVDALQNDPRAVVAHGAVRNHGLRTDICATDSIRGEPVERVREFLRRRPTAAELGWRGVTRSGAIAAGVHLRTRRSDGQFSNTLWSLELLLLGDAISLEGEYYEKFTDSDGLSRIYHGRNLEERSKMLSDTVANVATLLTDHGVTGPEREELVRMWAEWVLTLGGNWNALTDGPVSDARSLKELRPAIARFIADLAASMMTPPRR